MKMNRNWITPFTTGAFLLSAVTGILIFFHIDLGLNKFIHEWFSWALVCGVIFHLVINFKALIRTLSVQRGILIVGIFVTILAVSFVPMGKNKERPFVLPIRALSQVPLTTLADVAQITPQELMQRLSKKGIHVTPDQHNLSDIVGDDPRKQMHILNDVLKEKGQTSQPR